MGEPGPWKRDPGLDRWARDRWSTDAEAVRARHEEEDRRPAGTNTTVHRDPNSGLWLWRGEVPRTCSFCGGIHPEDAIRLLAEGWENEKVKPYKGYLNPPGTRTKRDAFLASLRDPRREPGQGVPSVWSPVPPVKLYVMHFDDAALARLNETLKPGG